MVELKSRIEAGTLKDLPGMGEKKLKKILENLAHLATSAGRIRIGEAMPVALELVGFLKTLKGVEDVQYCGSLRRGRETIGDIDIAVSADDQFGETIGKALTKHAMTASVIQVGPSKTSIRTITGIQVDVRVVPAESFGAAVQYFTGSKEHGVKLRELAIKKGMKLSEWGVFKVEKGGKETQIAGKTEEEVYGALGMAWIPPEMREDHGEIEWAIEHRKDKTEHVLVELGDIRGDLHMHTEIGRASCREKV